MVKIKMPLISENEDLKKEFSYPTDLEINLNRPLMIGVQAPYEFFTLHEKTFIISTKSFNEDIKTDLLDKVINTSDIYNPFEKFNIESFLNTVMSIDLKDPKSILDFYNSFGPLGYEGQGTKRGEQNNDINRIFGFNTDTARESLTFFGKEITLLQHFIQLYDAIKNEDGEFLRTFEHLAKYALAPKEKIDQNTPKEKLFILAKRAILIAINEKSNLINPVVGLVEGEFTKFTSASCLLGVFYLRLYELVTDNHKMKRCRYCGDYFIPRKANANFCPPPEANERSKCANRYDAMVRRIAEWRYKEGLTIEEIQKKLTKPKSRSEKEIQYILNNYQGKLKK